ncbi:HIT-like domain-containing protein [Cercophora scortea]|uniref:Aprataxin-like protein n=1 Tax=Cercophora scortea TaxID=314031 RepID=A0AAE0IG56_9PEZI|nr:HIT-like domain-containing protein [Cercophora scortea]
MPLHMFILNANQPNRIIQSLRALSHQFSANPSFAMTGSRSDHTKGAKSPPPDDTVTQQGASPSSPASSSIAPPPPPDPAPKKRNAFLELMSPKHKSPKTAVIPADPHSHAAAKLKKGSYRGALLEYIQHPDRFPASQVLRTTPNTVLIRDAFPKATVHLLLLPRSPAHYEQHPHEALSDPAFLATIRAEAETAARLAAAELARQLSPFSASSKARNDALATGTVPYDDLPAGRDYLPEIRIGVHAHPSMAHLHVHILSRDMHSDRLKHRKHYNSFNTPFFVPLADYPLAEDDERRDSAFQNANLGRDLVCWACGKGFGNKFAELKRHLDDEFELWKKR